MKSTNHNQNLLDYYLAHQGKISDKWQLYFTTHQNALSSYQDKAISLLEIGIQNGGSLEIWAKYFPQAKHLIGCDINPDCAKLQYQDPRITLYIGDANNEITRQNILNQSPQFDIIIDDGSHHSADIIRTFALYFDQLKDDGVYIIEDLHCSYWQSFLGGLNQPYSSINFLKNLIDIVNFEHWGLPLSREAVLQEHFQAFQCPTPYSLDHIHSVEFYNSVCIIKKRSPQFNELGNRYMCGTEAHVNAEILQNKQQIIRSITPKQDTNNSMLSMLTMQRLLQQRLAEYELLNIRLTEENQKLRQMVQQTHS